MLKYILFILLLNNWVNFTKAQVSYQLGDTLYVWAQSGLNMRSNPSLDSKKIDLLSFGSQVIIEQYDHRKFEITAYPSFKYIGYNKEEKIAPEIKFNGSWVQVSVKGKVGYVFDGYLNRFPAPIENEAFIEYANRNFILLDLVTIPYDRNRTFFDKHRSIYNNGIIYSYAKQESSSEVTIIFPELSFQEAQLIIRKFFFPIIFENLINPYGEELQNYEVKGKKIRIETYLSQMELRTFNDISIMTILRGC